MRRKQQIKAFAVWTLVCMIVVSTFSTMGFGNPAEAADQKDEQTKAVITSVDFTHNGTEYTGNEALFDGNKGSGNPTRFHLGAHEQLELRVPIEQASNISGVRLYGESGTNLYVLWAMRVREQAPDEAWNDDIWKEIGLLNRDINIASPSKPATVALDYGNVSKETVMVYLQLQNTADWAVDVAFNEIEVLTGTIYEPDDPGPGPDPSGQTKANLSEVVFVMNGQDIQKNETNTKLKDGDTTSASAVTLKIPANANVELHLPLDQTYADISGIRFYGSGANNKPNAYGVSRINSGDTNGTSISHDLGYMDFSGGKPNTIQLTYGGVSKETNKLRLNLSNPLPWEAEWTFYEIEVLTGEIKDGGDTPSPTASAQPDPQGKANLSEVVFVMDGKDIQKNETNTKLKDGDTTSASAVTLKIPANANVELHLPLDQTYENISGIRFYGKGPDTKPNAYNVARINDGDFWGSDIGHDLGYLDLSSGNPATIKLDYGNVSKGTNKLRLNLSNPLPWEAEWTFYEIEVLTGRIDENPEPSVTPSEKPTEQTKAKLQEVVFVMDGKDMQKSETNTKLKDGDTTSASAVTLKIPANKTVELHLPIEKSSDVSGIRFYGKGPDTKPNVYSVVRINDGDFWGTDIGHDLGYLDLSAGKPNTVKLTYGNTGKETTKLRLSMTNPLPWEAEWTFYEIEVLTGAIIDDNPGPGPDPTPGPSADPGPDPSSDPTPAVVNPYIQSIRTNENDYSALFDGDRNTTAFSYNMPATDDPGARKKIIITFKNTTVLSGLTLYSSEMTSGFFRVERTRADGQVDELYGDTITGFSGGKCTLNFKETFALYETDTVTLMLCNWTWAGGKPIDTKLAEIDLIKPDDTIFLTDSDLNKRITRLSHIRSDANITATVIKDNNKKGMQNCTVMFARYQGGRLDDLKTKQVMIPGYATVRIEPPQMHTPPDSGQYTYEIYVADDLLNMNYLLQPVKFLPEQESV